MKTQKKSKKLIGVPVYFFDEITASLLTKTLLKYRINPKSKTSIYKKN